MSVRRLIYIVITPGAFCHLLTNALFNERYIQWDSHNTLGSILLIWINFSPSMDKNNIHYKVWNEITQAISS